MIGLSISAICGAAPDVSVPNPPPPPTVGEITAVLPPAVSRLYAGQSVSDMADYVVMTTAANFVSNAGSVISVEVATTGDTASALAPLDAGQSVGFTVTVTDDATPATTRVFTTALQAVETRADVISVDGNLVDIQINDLVPDSALLDIVIAGTPGYDGTYTPTAGDLRSGAYHFSGTAAVTHDGPASALSTGSVMTHDDGLWYSPTGDLTLTRQARADSSDIAGATGSTYTLTASDLGTDYRLAITGDDGANTPLTVTTSAIAIALPGEITATLAPAGSRLYVGQSVSDMVDYAAMTAPGNFSSTAGTITSVDVVFTGDATSATDPLSEADTAGFTVTVTDDATPATTRVFTTALQTVEYDVRILETMGNEAEIDINDLVPDAETLTISITGGTPYDGIYTPMAGDLRNNAYNFAGTAQVAHDGAASALTTGSTMTHDDGLWSTPTGALTVSRQAQIDGIAIPGATGASHDLRAEDLGGAYTVAITADDGTHTPVIAQTPAIAIPGTSGVTVTELASDAIAATGAVAINNTLDTGPATAGQDLYILVAYGKVSSTSDAIAVTVDGIATTQVDRLTVSKGLNLAIHRIAAETGGSRALEITTQDGVAWRGVSYQALTAVGHTTETVVSDQNSAFAALDLSAPVSAGAQIIGAAGMLNRGSGSTFAYAGLSQTAAADSQGSKAHAFMAADVTADETRIMTVTPTGAGSGDVAAAILILS